MTPLALTLCAFSGFSLAPSQGFDPAQVPELAPAFEVISELADLDQDGNVTSSELEAFSIAVGALGERIEDFSLMIVLQGLDQDGLAQGTLKDISGSLQALDANGDGQIQASEATLERMTQGRMGTRGLIRRLAHELLLEESDGDGDGRVTAVEQAALLKALGAELDVAQAKGWAERSKQREAADRNRMAPGVAFLTLEKEVDQNGDGILDLERYRAWFRGRDTNGDNTLSTPERNAPQAQVDREFWREPNPERMALPALMPWQRNLKDALAVQARTGQPLLICVNRDDEKACDALAAWRYRDPAFAELADGYVCLVVSPDDHQPREYDDRGRRMVSPRLGRVTDREHIDLEPELFARYFKGYRVAPRHVGVAPDGSILFDRYLINDPKVLDARLAEFAQPVEALDFAAMETELLAGYPDALAREEMERRMLTDDPVERLKAAAFVGSMPDAGMLGLRDPDPAVREASALALCANPGRLDSVQAQRLMAAAVTMAPDTRGKVLASLSTSVDDPAVAAAAQRALDPSATVSTLGRVEDWQAAASLATLSVPPTMDKNTALLALERVDAAIDPESASPAQALVRAGALLQLAQSLAYVSEDPRDAVAEALVSARKAAEADLGRASAIEAVASALIGDYPTAVRASRLALPSLWAAPSDPLTLDALRALQKGATQLVYGQMRDKQPVVRALVADALLAGRTLLAHPAGTEEDATMLLYLAQTAGAAAVEPELLLEALTRYPGSVELNRRFRDRQLASTGAASMGARYDALANAVDGAIYGPTVDWYRGLALLVAAEWELSQDGQPAAYANYKASVAAFRASLEAETAFEDSARHYMVLAHAGAASLALEAEDMEAAADQLHWAAALRPSSLDLKDGLGLTPRERAATVLPALMPHLDETKQAAFLRVFPELK